MKRILIGVLAACTLLSVSACSKIGPLLGRLEQDMQEDAMVDSDELDAAPVKDDTDTGKILIDEVGDVMLGRETESEESMIEPNESEEADMTEAETQTVTESIAQTEETVQTEEEVLAGGLISYGKKSYGPLERPLKELIESREAMGEHWSIAYEDLASGKTYGFNEEDVMQSASVVKLFIMGAVYRYMCYPPEGEEVIQFGEEYSGQLKDVITSMITVSDNDCANLLIDRLGGGDFSLGAQRIAEFCKENGYVGTSIGRRFLEQNPSGDNFTTAADTRKFLSDLYHGKLINEEASEKMLQIVMGQTRKNKIPAGLPAGFTSGNKTGEMPEGYGLGCIENDSAIVFPPEGMGEGYVLTVMSNDLGGRNSEAISTIAQVSSMVAQWYTEQEEEQSTELSTEPDEGQ